MRILGIETSCDDTGVAVFDDTDGILVNLKQSQNATHAPHGGIVPELASRDHIQNTLPLIRQALKQAERTTQRRHKPMIDAIAYTAGPGLIGSLLVGAGLAKTLAWSWDIPCLPIHHMEAHLLAPFLDSDIDLTFPFLALLVSGGHTLLVLARELGQYTILGESLDDAVGEAFDKVAQHLGLPFPGGPAIEMCAKRGDPNRFQFPRPMSKQDTLDLSFSGLKTAVMLTCKQHTTHNARFKADVAASFQKAAIDSLVIKCKAALQKTRMTQLVIAGGVSANQSLRQAIIALEKPFNMKIHCADLAYCTDNGAMVAYTGYRKLSAQKMKTNLTIQVKPNWSITEPDYFLIPTFLD